MPPAKMSSSSAPFVGLSRARRHNVFAIAALPLADY
jgi:hypothetical protein